MEVDPELIVPDEDKSPRRGRHPPLVARHTKDYFGRLIGALADALGFRTDIPFAGLPLRARKALLYGHKTQVEVRYRNRYGRERRYTTAFEGAIPFVKRRHSEAESDASRERFEGYMREVPCPTWQGHPPEAARPSRSPSWASRSPRSRRCPSATARTSWAS
ncbi:hypothetical protein LV779_33040 [Streptomyces thinghirensis]|nr:hypothetical protein [Streptomyces thinghirensis]